MKSRDVCSFVLAVFSLALAWVAQAVPMGTNDAARAVGAWVRRGGAFGARLGSRVASVAIHTTTNGLSFYSVQTVGGGTVFTSADDALEPILAFSSDSAAAAAAHDPKSPLHALLNRDIIGRSAAHQTARRLAATTTSLTSSTASTPSTSSTLSTSQPLKSSKWSSLLDEATQYEARTAAGVRRAAFGSVSSVGDLRVPPLVQSKWSQEADGKGSPCYNCYTPNNYVCGCVATAMSQIMRMHGWPQESRATVKRSCFVDDAAQDKTTMGGVYDWANMPLEPNGADAAAMTDVQRQAIGKLCYDAGVSVRMDWTSDGSGAFSPLVGAALRDVFGYGSAYSSVGMGTSVDADALARKILANLGAGYPVLLGIGYSVGENYSNGHAIVGDGYGYNNNVLYVHLNMGWSGTSDLWYQLPDIGQTAYYYFNSVDDIVYNIIPDGSDAKAVLSGRVTQTNGVAVAAAKVSIYAVDSDTPVANVTANAYGVYGAVLPAGVAYRVRATDGTLAGVATMTSALKAPVSADFRFNGKIGSTTYNFTTTKYVDDGAEIGNAMGVDVMLGNAPITYEIATSVVGHGTVTKSASSVAPGGEITFTFSTDRPLNHIETNGVALVIEGNVFVWRDIRADGSLTAYFDALDFYVDATDGSDGNDGQTPETAFATITKALGQAADGETIYVLPGVYAPVEHALDASGSRVCVNLVSTDGPEATFIDGGGATSCVYDEAGVLTVDGFTLRNGNSGRYADGGGAWGGTYHSCVITNCVATQYGGGACQARLFDCTVVGNTAGGKGSNRDKYGGGLDYCDASNCVIRANVARGSGYVCGGGFSRSVLMGCLVYDNYVCTAQKSISWYCYGGGGYNSEADAGTYVWNNLARTESSFDSPVSANCRNVSGDYHEEFPPSPSPVSPPGGEVDVPEGLTSQEYADAINATPEAKAQLLKAPGDVPTTPAYLSYFGAVPSGETSVTFVLNETGTNAVVAATRTVETNALAAALSPTATTLAIAEPLVGFYYSLKQGGSVTNLGFNAQADQNRLGGRDEISFSLLKPDGTGFYQTLVTPTEYGDATE